MYTMVETAIIQMDGGKWDGREFVVEIDPQTLEPITPVTISEDGNYLLNQHGTVVGHRYVEKDTPKIP